jgi:hypothetical protein
MLSSEYKVVFTCRLCGHQLSEDEFEGERILAHLFRAHYDLAEALAESLWEAKYSPHQKPAQGLTETE